MLVTRLSGIRTFDVVDVPAPVVGPTDVLVRVTAVSICGSDLAAFLGNHVRIKAPVILGHEFAGVVEAVGSEVSGPSVGTRVAVEPTIGCRQCRFCLSGRENICPDYRVIGEELDIPGAFVGLVCVAADHAHPLPDSVSDDEGAIVQPLAIGLHAVRDRARVQAGETVLVVGGGPIGAAIQLACQAVGARVMVTDRWAERLARAAQLGAHRVIDASTEDVLAVVRQETDGYGVDAAIEAAGGPTDASFELAFRATSRGGRMVVLGAFRSQTLPLPVNEMKSREVDVLGSQAHPASFRDVIDRIAAGTLPANRLISHRLPMSQVVPAFDLLTGGAGDVMKVVLHP